VAPEAAPAENRTFDPAVLDLLVRETGAEAASAAVAEFVAGAARDLEALRASVARGAAADAARLAGDLARTAQRLGLLRLRRAAAALAAGPVGGRPVSEEQVAALEPLLWSGVEELRMWRP
jgi:hypothetical protein